MKQFFSKYKMIVAGIAIVMAGALMQQPSLIISGATVLEESINVDSPR